MYIDITKYIVKIIALSLLHLVSIGPVFAEQARFVQGAGGYNGVTDFTVKSGFDGQIEGTTLHLQRFPAGREDGLVSFKNIFQPSGPIPLGAKINSARVGFAFKSNDGMFVELRELYLPIEEINGILHTSRYSAPIASYAASTTNNQLVYKNINDQITRLSVNLPMHGFLLIAGINSPNGDFGVANIYSSESSNITNNFRPTLVIDYDPSNVYLPSGDYNNDGLINAVDFDQQARIMTNDAPYHPSLDIDKNGQIDFKDRIYEIINRAGIVPGDANLDGVFDSTDLVALFQAGQYSDGISKNSTWATGDFNGDREFDSSDLVFANQYNVQ